MGGNQGDTMVNLQDDFVSRALAKSTVEKPTEVDDDFIARAMKKAGITEGVPIEPKPMGSGLRVISGGPGTQVYNEGEREGPGDLFQKISEAYKKAKTSPMMEAGKGAFLTQMPGQEGEVPIKRIGKQFMKTWGNKVPAEVFAPLVTKDFWKKVIPGAIRQLGDMTKQMGMSQDVYKPSPGKPYEEQLSIGKKPYKSVMEEKNKIGIRDIQDATRNVINTGAGFATFLPDTVLGFMADPIGFTEKEPLAVAMVGTMLMSPSIKAIKGSPIDIPKEIKPKVEKAMKEAFNESQGFSEPQFIGQKPFPEPKKPITKQEMSVPEMSKLQKEGGLTEAVIAEQAKLRKESGYVPEMKTVQQSIKRNPQTGKKLTAEELRAAEVVEQGRKDIAYSMGEQPTIELPGQRSLRMQKELKKRGVEPNIGEMKPGEIKGGGLLYGAELPTKVGNIRIDKLNSTYDVKKTLVEIGDRVASKRELSGATKKVSWKETESLAANLGMTVEQLKKSRKGRDEPYNYRLHLATYICF